MANRTTSLRDHLMIELLFTLGIRISELLSLETDHVDLTNQRVLIKQLKKRQRKVCPGCNTRVGRRVKYCPYCAKLLDALSDKETERKRILPISERVAELLRVYISNRDGNSKRLFNLSRQRAYRIVVTAAHRAGLRGRILIHPHSGRFHYVSPHKLRDSFAQHVLSIDNSLEQQLFLQQALGHQNFETTTRYLKMEGSEFDERWKRLWQ